MRWISGLIQHHSTYVLTALITSGLNYYMIAFYTGLPLRISQELSWCKNTALHVSTVANRKYHITGIFKELHWFPVTFHAQFKLLVNL